MRRLFRSWAVVAFAVCIFPPMEGRNFWSSWTTHRFVFAAREVKPSDPEPEKLPAFDDLVDDTDEYRNSPRDKTAEPSKLPAFDPDAYLATPAKAPEKPLPARDPALKTTPSKSKAPTFEELTAPPTIDFEPDPVIDFEPDPVIDFQPDGVPAAKPKDVGFDAASAKPEVAGFDAASAVEEKPSSPIAPRVNRTFDVFDVIASTDAHEHWSRKIVRYEIAWGVLGWELCSFFALTGIIALASVNYGKGILFGGCLGAALLALNAPRAARFSPLDEFRYGISSGDSRRWLWEKSVPPVDWPHLLMEYMALAGAISAMLFLGAIYRERKKTEGSTKEKTPISDDDSSNATSQADTDELHSTNEYPVSPPLELSTVQTDAAPPDSPVPADPVLKFFCHLACLPLGFLPLLTIAGIASLLGFKPDDWPSVIATVGAGMSLVIGVKLSYWIEARFFAKPNPLEAQSKAD